MLTTEEKIKASLIADEMMVTLTKDFEGKKMGYCLEFISLSIAIMIAALIYTSLRKESSGRQQSTIDFIANLSKEMLEEVGREMNNAK